MLQPFAKAANQKPLQIVQGVGSEADMPNKQVIPQPWAAPDIARSNTLETTSQEGRLESLAGVRKPVTSIRREVPQRGRAPSPAFEPLLDLHEAAAILGMHWKTLEAKARGREIPAFKVGKRWRFRVSSLNQWLDHGINSNTTDQAVLTR